MRNTIKGLVVVAVTTSAPSLHAASVARVVSLEPEAWIVTGESQRGLETGAELNSGEYIVTGGKGRVKLEIGDNVSLVLDAGSEFVIPPTQATVSDDHPGLHLKSGRLCISYNPLSGRGEKFGLNLGDMLFAAVQHRSRICALRREALSSVSLREGSVQITHAIDSSMIVISDAGTEIRIDDSGVYQLLLPGDNAHLTLYDESPLTTGRLQAPANADQPPETRSQTVLPAEAVVPPDVVSPAGDTAPSAYSYTVYLFSTRSEAVAEKVNRNLQNAGHETLIIVTERDSVTHYRIAVSGFDNRASAKQYADSIVGKLGIADAWIGKQRNVVPPESM